ncbi:hypothetical protein BHE74_00002572 [Ensete ventricosum]|nr:hypothetical protein GW17_00008080 [Ensete ventricosum]RWW88550.1 hypothetical protein BHE74_00002572 [Ensete ventricosum]RZR81208.1 hypothetical protein BHM03_00007396 [Ensete ventricosum]
MLVRLYFCKGFSDGALLQTNDLNSAFEATRKAHICLAAAVDSFGKDRVDCLSSVRKALNFNFHNVDRLLRHVRLSLDSIGR